MLFLHRSALRSQAKRFLRNKAKSRQQSPSREETALDHVRGAWPGL